MSVKQDRAHIFVYTLLMQLISTELGPFVAQKKIGEFFPTNGQFHKFTHLT